MQDQIFYKITPRWRDKDTTYNFSIKSSFFTHFNIIFEKEKIALEDILQNHKNALLYISHESEYVSYVAKLIIKFCK